MPDQLFSDPEAISEYDDGWQPLINVPSLTVNVCTMTIPRPLWMMDGTHDECWGSPRAPDAEEVYAKARLRWQAGRDEILAATRRISESQSILLRAPEKEAAL